MNRQSIRTLAFLSIAATIAAALWVGLMLTRSDPAERIVTRGTEEPAPAMPSALDRSLSDPRADSPDHEGSVPSSAIPHEDSPFADQSGDAEAETFEDPTGDLDIYLNAPMSTVPHRVARGWGMGGGSLRPGAVGAVVIVEPGISEASLEQLVRDIQAYHSREDAVSVRIMNDAYAATYDRHGDGGALAQRHLVAQIVRNEEVDIDEMRIGDRILEP